VSIESKQLAFYVQAGASIGLGHLTRSLAVSQAMKSIGFEVRFIIASDDYGRAKADSLGMSSEEVGTSNDVIIDAATIPEDDVRYLKRFSNRILISPVCNRADIATQVMVRAVSDTLKSSLAQNTLVIEDSSFAYTTTKYLKPRALNFEKIRVGICLSGGEDSLNLRELVSTIAESPPVSEIYVLHHHALNVSPRNGVTLFQEFYSNDPWSYFSNINVFIGGDGLLISESVAQGIPSISLTTQSNFFKNKYLNGLGCLECFSRESLDYSSLQQLLSDREALAKMHQIALNQPSPDGAKLLAQSICHIVKN